MTSMPQFKAAFPYQNDVLALPVTDLDAASQWYSKHFGMLEVERFDEPVPTVILERDGTRIGFAINGGDPARDGAAVLVSNIGGMKVELEAKGVNVGNWRVDERDITIRTCLGSGTILRSPDSTPFPSPIACRLTRARSR